MLTESFYKGKNVNGFTEHFNIVGRDFQRYNTKILESHENHPRLLYFWKVYFCAPITHSAFFAREHLTGNKA